MSVVKTSIPLAEQFLHVLPALGMTRAGHVGVGELVDQHQLRMPCDGRVQIELLEPVALVLELLGREHGEPFEQRRRLAPAVGLDDPHHDIAPLLLELARRREHRVGLAYTGRGAEVDAQLPASGLRFLLLELRQQNVRVGSVSVGCGHGLGWVSRSCAHQLTMISPRQP